MTTKLPDQKFVPISGAAKYLDVSIDTVRRWDKSGILHSQRLDGKDRYFDPVELKRVKFSRPLLISEASQKLGLSMSTLRRLEKKGLIELSRDKNGQRTYSQDALEKFLKSAYFLRQGALEEQIAETESNATVVNHRNLAQEPTNEPVAHKRTSLPGIFLMVVLVFVVLLSVAYFLVSSRISSSVLGTWIGPAGSLESCEIGRSCSFGTMLQDISRVAGEVLGATWNYSGRSFSVFNPLAGVAGGLIFVVIAGIIFSVLYLITLTVKSEPSTVLAGDGQSKWGSLVLLILSISLGLAAGLATGRLVEKVDALSYLPVLVQREESAPQIRSDQRLDERGVYQTNT